MVIEDKVKELQKINVNKLIDEAIEELTEYIINLNQDQLYKKGDIDVKYPGIKWHYADSTKKAKKKYAQFKKTDFITLRWTGDFYESFVLEIRDKDFLIRAMDDKWQFLEKDIRFENALGLTDESKEELRLKILPLVIKKLRDEL